MICFIRFPEGAGRMGKHRQFFTGACLERAVIRRRTAEQNSLSVDRK